MKVEGYHFDMRKHLLDYDDVLNQQREIIYADRHAILDESDLKAKILDMVRHEFDDLMSGHLASRHSDDWDVPSFISELGSICPLPDELANEDLVYQLSHDEVRRALADHADRTYDLREEELGSEQMRTLERLLLLRAIDTHWVNHLTSMENLRTGIGLQAYGQRDPLVAYRGEGRKMFLDLMKRMQYDVVHSLFHVAVNQQPANGTARRPRGSENASPMRAVNNPQRNEVPVAAGKIGRNSQCPCGSGKKYKRCHGANV